MKGPECRLVIELTRQQPCWIHLLRGLLSLRHLRTVSSHLRGYSLSMNKVEGEEYLHMHNIYQPLQNVITSFFFALTLSHCWLLCDYKRPANSVSSCDEGRCCTGSNSHSTTTANTHTKECCFSPNFSSIYIREFVCLALFIYVPPYSHTPTIVSSWLLERCLTWSWSRQTRATRNSAEVTWVCEIQMMAIL